MLTRELGALAPTPTPPHLPTTAPSLVSAFAPPIPAASPTSTIASPVRTGLSVITSGAVIAVMLAAGTVASDNRGRVSLL